MNMDCSFLFRCLALSMMLLPMTQLLAKERPLYQIVNVKSWDTLNVRAAAGSTNDVVAVIPADGEEITFLVEEMTGYCRALTLD